MVAVVRSLAFNVAFYLATGLMLVAGAVPFLLMGQRAGVNFARSWGAVCIVLARVIAGIRLDIRGRENIPKGGAIVASKHQSAYETFALLPPLSFPTFVLKKELRWIPLFGLYTVASGMIHVERGGGSAALRYLLRRAGVEIAKDRQVIIFPEGTRRSPGASPEYHHGVARLYKSLGVPVVPVALNTGLFWPRRKFMRFPGTAVIEFLPPIPPGLDSRGFMARLQDSIEEASARLVAEAAGSSGAPPVSGRMPATTSVESAEKLSP